RWRDACPLFDSTLATEILVVMDRRHRIRMLHTPLGAHPIGFKTQTLPVFTFLRAIRYTLAICNHAEKIIACLFHVAESLGVSCSTTRCGAIANMCADHGYFTCHRGWCAASGGS